MSCLWYNILLLILWLLRYCELWNTIHWLIKFKSSTFIATIRKTSSRILRPSRICIEIFIALKLLLTSSNRLLLFTVGIANCHWLNLWILKSFIDFRISFSAWDWCETIYWFLCFTQNIIKLSSLGRFLWFLILILIFLLLSSSWGWWLITLKLLLSSKAWWAWLGWNLYHLTMMMLLAL